MTEYLSQTIAACQRGDVNAQRLLYEQFKGKMFVLCQRYTRRREDAEDVLQEGFIKVFRDIPQYSGDGSFEGWIRKVIVNTALQFLRKNKRAPQEIAIENIDFKLHYEEPDLEGDTKDRAKEIIKLMQLMPDGFRTVLNLYILEGYSHQEISEIMGISVGTSKSQLNRAKANLKKLLEQSLLLK